jgi:hypothetical protein
MLGARNIPLLLFSQHGDRGATPEALRQSRGNNQEAEGFCWTRV